MEVFKTLLLVSLVFILCWAPIDTYIFLAYVGYNLDFYGTVAYLLLFISYFNLLLNPILYAYQYRSIRQSVVKILTRSKDGDTVKSDRSGSRSMAAIIEVQPRNVI